MARTLILATLFALPALASAAEFRYTETDDSGNNIALGYPVPQPRDATQPGDYFRSYDFLLARHQALALDDAQVEGHVVGSTRKGENIWAYVLGDADMTTAEYGTPEGAVLINGGIHAREWQSPESVSFLMEHLASIRDDDGVGRYLADNLNVIVVPVLNVDGFRQTQLHWDLVTQTVETPRDGRMRRKNMFLPAGGTVDNDLSTTNDNLHGVDLNRNSQHGFGINGGSESDPESLVNHGSAAASESEIQALLAAAALGPVESLRMFTDTHSFSQLYYVPQTGDAKRDAYALYLVGLKAGASQIGYAVVPEPVGTPIGTTADYFAYEYGVPAWTLELEPQYAGAPQYGGVGVSHDGFILPEDEVARMREDTLRMHMAGLYAQAGPPAVVDVAISDAASGELRYAAHWRHDSATARTLIVDTDLALVPQREYVAIIRFNKPMTDFDNDQAGDASVYFAALGEEPATALGNAQWLSDATQTRRYRGDTLRLAFTLDETAGGVPTRFAFAIDGRDFNGTKLDADPGTPVTWSEGRFIRHDAFAGDAEWDEFGGVDCNFRPYIANDADAEPPAADSADCSFWAEARATAAPVNNGNGGGGGAACLLWLLLGASLLRARRYGVA